jgi:TIGR03009 family protein
MEEIAMRAWMFFVAVAALFVVAYAVAAQQPAAVPRTPAKTDPDRLNQLMHGWELKSRDTRDFWCKFDRITTDATFGQRTIEHGIASGVRPYIGRLDLFDDTPDANGRYRNFTQVFIFNGKSLFQYEFKTKQAIEHVLPDVDARGRAMPGPLAFIFGMSAAEARERFDLTLVREFSRDVNGQSIDYALLHAEPKTDTDMRDFKLAKIVIERKTFLPRQIVIEEPEGNTQDWRFVEIKTNVNPPISPNDKDLQPFDAKSMPKDWKQIKNNWGGAEAAQPKAKSTLTPPAGKGKSEATRPVAPKR